MKKSLKFMTNSWDLKGDVGKWFAKRLAEPSKPNAAQRRTIERVRSSS